MRALSVLERADRLNFRVRFRVYITVIALNYIYNNILRFAGTKWKRNSQLRCVHSNRYNNARALL